MAKTSGVVEVSSLHRTEVFVSHRNARLTVHGRRLLVERVSAGRPVAHVAAEMGISRATAHKWVRRWRAEGEAGLADRSSRPHTTPHRTSPGVEAQVCDLRQTRKLGPARIGPILGLPASTVHRILTRHGLNRLAFMDRHTGQVIRRYERDRPGELVHIDVKKLGRIPDGGGHKTLGGWRQRPGRRSGGSARPPGYAADGPALGATGCRTEGPGRADSVRAAATAPGAGMAGAPPAVDPAPGGRARS